MADNDDTTPIECQDAKQILSKVLTTILKRFYDEQENKTQEVPFNDPEARLQYYIGMTSTAVNKLIQKSKMTKLNMQSRILLLETVKNMYAQNRIQNCPVTLLYDEITKNGGLQTFDGNGLTGLHEFVEVMEILGYQWKKTLQNERLLIEDPEIRFERYLYLNKLKKFRNNSTQWQIVYVDERLVNDTCDFPKPWLTNSEYELSSSLHESVFYHAVSKNGFITGMFSNQASESDFAKWLIDILLMHLKTPTVIIMDNNPMHGSLENVSSITRYHCKNDMLSWLTYNNIACNDAMSKPSLFELINKSNAEHQEYKIDRIIKSQGHEVLRLPRYFYDLTMTTPVWEDIIKSTISETTLIHLQNKLMGMINSIPSSKWPEYEQSVEKYEREIFNIDMAMEKLSEKFQIKLNS